MSNGSFQHSRSISFRDEDDESYPEWEHKKLRDVINLHSGRDQKGFEDPDGQYPILATGGEIGRTNTPLCRDESVLIGRKGTIDKPQYMSTPFRTVDTLFYTTMKDGISARFVYVVVQTVKWKQLSEASGVPSLNSSIILNIDCPVPSLPEQEKIAGFFSALDERIALTADKVKLLKEQKQGYLQKVFSRELSFTDDNGEAYPEWEQKMLSELEATGVVRLSRGKVISKTEMRSDPGEYPVYSSSVLNNGLMGKYGQFSFDEELISWSVDGGGHFFYRPKHKFSITNVSGVLQVKDASSVNCRFLSYALGYQHGSLKFDYSSKAHPSVIRSIYNVPLPSILEQDKIASFFSALDVQIELNEKKLSILKEQKSGYLQAIFG